MRWLVLLLVACSAPPTSTPTRGVPLGGEAGERTSKIPIVDSHVHLAYYPVATELAEHGVGAVVDLASPESALETKYPIKVIRSGPMLTRPGGYPLDSWGAAGYGIGCADFSCIRETIARLKREGAGVIKVALDDHGLDPALAMGAINYAHKLQLKVVVHALSDKSARLAGEINADVLAHTPVEPLSEETIATWRRGTQRAVISTLAAFGGGDAAVANLRRLRDAGLTVLYGTDLGNLRVDGPSSEEIALLKRAGMSETAIEAAMTTAPWYYWGFGIDIVPANGDDSR